MEMGLSLTLLPTLRNISFLPGCLAQCSYEEFCLVFFLIIINFLPFILHTAQFTLPPLLPFPSLISLHPSPHKLLLHLHSERGRSPVGVNKACASSYCILLRHIQLISLGDLLFNKGKWRRVGEIWRSRGRRNCDWHVFFTKKGKENNASQIIQPVSKGTPPVSLRVSYAPYNDLEGSIWFIPPQYVLTSSPTVLPLLHSTLSTMPHSSVSWYILKHPRHVHICASGLLHLLLLNLGFSFPQTVIYQDAVSSKSLSDHPILNGKFCPQCFLQYLFPCFTPFLLRLNHEVHRSPLHTVTKYPRCSGKQEDSF